MTKYTIKQKKDQMLEKIFIALGDRFFACIIVVGTHTTDDILTGPTFVPVGKFGNDFCNGRARLPEVRGDTGILRYP